MYRIFNKDIVASELFTVNLTQEEVKLVLEGNMFRDHPELIPDDCIIIEQEAPFNYPTFDKKVNTIREMTREEQILILSKIDLLYEGEYIKNGKIITVPVPDNLFQKKWESPNWIEGMNLEERIKTYDKMIDKYKDEIRESGFIYISSKEKITHNQKARDKDTALLLGKMNAQKILESKYPDKKTKWYFNKEDILETDFNTLQDIFVQGSLFIQAVFDAEGYFKSLEPNNLLSIDDFRNKIDEISEVKCYKSL